MMIGINQLNQNSSKPLVTYLKTIVQPQDEIVNYFRFFQDVPLYLGKQITIVADWHNAAIPYKDNWLRELWYGLSWEKSQHLLVDEKTFWQHWNSHHRVFVFVNANYLDQFKQQADHYFYLEKNNDIILLSNRL
jgi:hypothetical protein